MSIVIIIFILIGFYFIYVKIRDRRLLKTVTQTNRGTKSERDLVLRLLKSGVPAQTIFHDLYLQRKNGTYSQIDLVVATKVGLMVFEIKDYSGWIFGKGYEQKWTQVLAFGKLKYSFYNPILQNKRHISNLQERIKDFKPLPYYSIVVFYGDCVFKDVSFIPDGTYLTKSNRVGTVIKKILKESDLAIYSNIGEVVNVLKDAVKKGESRQTQIQHVRNINDMLGNDRIFQ